MIAEAQQSDFISDSILASMLQGRRRWEQAPDAVFRIRRPHIERGIVACVMRLEDTTTQELLAGKVLLPMNDGIRDYSLRVSRHEALKQCMVRSLQFAPEGVCVGLRPVLSLKDDMLFCGSITNPDALDRRFEYVWFMHMFKSGESLEEKLQRNAAVLQPLARAIHDAHDRADKLSLETAWNFGNPDKLLQKLFSNLTFFEKLLDELKGAMPRSEWQALWPSLCMQQLSLLSERLFRDEKWKQTCILRVEAGYVRKGHGDLKIKNIWFSDYYRTELVRSFKDCVTFFDPVDFDDRFNTIDILSEAAMLLVDLQRVLAPVDFAQFMYAYAGFFEQWRRHDELSLLYYMMEKALVSAYIVGLFDRDLITARHYVWQLRIYLDKFVRQNELVSMP